MTADFALARCNTHAYTDCFGSRIYWYNSCSGIEDVYQDCANYGMTCQGGQCVYGSQTNNNSNYVRQSFLGCYAKSIYWYDSLRQPSDFYSSCADKNSCTVDGCVNAKCFSALKCDGSTCKAGSTDYQLHCVAKTNTTKVDTNTQQGNPDSEENLSPLENLTISFYVDAMANTQGQKTLELVQNSTAYFTITISNNSNFLSDNVIVSVNIPSEILYLGNLKVDGVPVEGDIVAGIEIGSITNNGKKNITFEGKTEAFEYRGQRTASAFINSAQTPKSDIVTINFKNALVSTESSASIISAPSLFGITGFIKKWYMWIIAGGILILLFAIIFKRLSSDT
jgi:hypothetical protein